MSEACSGMAIGSGRARCSSLANRLNRSPALVPRNLRAEPAGAAARTEPLLLCHLLRRRRVERARFGRAGQEVDVDAADASLAELDVAGALTEMTFGRLA